jgi:hypothetical protein
VCRFPYYSADRRAYQQDSFRDPASELLEFSRIAQKLHYFLQFLFGLVDAGYILESNLCLTLGKDLGLALGKRHDPHPRPHLFHRKPPDQKKMPIGTTQDRTLLRNLLS